MKEILIVGGGGREHALGWALKIPVNGKKVGELVEPKYE